MKSRAPIRIGGLSKLAAGALLLIATPAISITKSDQKIIDQDSKEDPCLSYAYLRFLAVNDPEAARRINVIGSLQPMFGANCEAAAAQRKVEEEDPTGFWRWFADIRSHSAEAAANGVAVFLVGGMLLLLSKIGRKRASQREI